jgi:hypothetical protein
MFSQGIVIRFHGKKQVIKLSDICGGTNLECIRCNPGGCNFRIEDVRKKQEIKLLPCPCCGGEVLKYYYGSVGNGIFLEIVCKECGIRTKRTIEQEAIKTWNTRRS